MWKVFSFHNSCCSFEVFAANHFLDDTSFETLVIIVKGKTQLLSLFSIWAYMATEAFHHRYPIHRHHQTSSYELRRKN